MIIRNFHGLTLSVYSGSVTFIVHVWKRRDDQLPHRKSQPAAEDVNRVGTRSSCAAGNLRIFGTYI